MIETVRVFLMNGLAVDVRCVKFGDEGGVFVGRLAPTEEVKVGDVVCMFGRDKVAGFMIVPADTPTSA